MVTFPWRQNRILDITIGENCAHVIYFLFSVVTTFSNFQATFWLISPKVFEIFTPKPKVRKIRLNFWYQNHSGFEKTGMMLWCGSCQALLNIFQTVSFSAATYEQWKKNMTFLSYQFSVWKKMKQYRTGLVV